MSQDHPHRQAPLTLSIERLRLDGPALSSRQARQLQQSIASELSRLQRISPLALQGGAMDLLRAPAVHATPSSDPVRLGIEIARGLHGALARAR